MAPRVCVVIPARDAAATLERAIRSVREQDYPCEIIVVDDASGDDTAAVAAALGAQVIRLDRPQGAAAARNAGIARAYGELIAFQDADDEWLPGKLRRQVALLLAEPRAVFVACGARLVGQDGDDRGPLYDGTIPEAGGQAWRKLLARNTIATPCVVVWRRALAAVGRFDEALPVAEDQDMWLRLAMHGQLAYLDEQLVRVHVTAISVSGVGTALGSRQQRAITLPMLRRHLAARRAELSRREVRGILAARLGRVGRASYSDGDYRAGLALVARAVWFGDPLVANLRFLLSASPWGRWAKRNVLGR
jgi:glycosyltransferase involved in cell wall biosynthesis